MRSQVCTSPDGQPVVPIRPGGVLGQQLAVGARVVEEALHRGPGGEPEQVVHAGGGLGQQRHVGVGAGAGHVVVAAVVPADPLALVARGVGGEVGLHADDRLDAGGRGLARRSRRRRTRCRGRSSRSRPCRARRCARTGRPAGPHRRAWSTRCGRAGGRSRRTTWVAAAPNELETDRWRPVPAGGRDSSLGEGAQPNPPAAPSWQATPTVLGSDCRRSRAAQSALRAARSATRRRRGSR